LKLKLRRIPLVSAGGKGAEYTEYSSTSGFTGAADATSDLLHAEDLFVGPDSPVPMLFRSDRCDKCDNPFEQVRRRSMAAPGLCIPCAWPWSEKREEKKREESEEPDSPVPVLGDGPDEGFTGKGTEYSSFTGKGSSGSTEYNSFTGKGTEYNSFTGKGGQGGQGGADADFSKYMDYQKDTKQDQGRSGGKGDGRYEPCSTSALVTETQSTLYA